MLTVGQIVNSQLVLMVILFSYLFVSGQESRGEEDPKQAVEAAVHTLFEGMREGDSAKVHSVFHHTVQMNSTGFQQDGKTRLSDGSLASFLKAVGSPHDEIWDERISDLTIQIDGPLATAWMKYSFYRGETFSHCGVNAMTFLLQDGKWTIIYLIDTRRKDKC